MPAPLDLEFASLSELREGLRKGSFTSEQLVITYLARIEELDGKLNAIAQLNEHALRDARASDERRARGTARSLEGLPIILKESISVLPPLIPACGMHIFLDCTRKREADVALNLRAEGAIILGLSNMHVSGWFRSKGQMPSSWSSRKGLGPEGHSWCRYGKDIGVSGSSGGSAIAADTGFCAAAVGAQTIGSLGKPGSQNNLVAFKGTPGLTPRDNVIGCSDEQDSVGFLTRTVLDAALMFQASMALSPVAERGIYEAACDVETAKGLQIGSPDAYNKLECHIGWSWVYTCFSKEQQEIELGLFEDAVQKMNEIGIAVARNVEFAAHDQLVDGPPDASFVLNAGFDEALRKWTSGFDQNPKKLTDLASIIKATEEDPGECLPEYDMDNWKEILATGKSTKSPDVIKARQHLSWTCREGGILGALDKDGLDALIMPSSAAYAIADCACLPIISVPCGFLPESFEFPRQWSTVTTQGSPAGPGTGVGVSFVGREGSEDKLLALAFAFENATHHRFKGKPWIRASIQIGDV